MSKSMLTLRIRAGAPERGATAVEYGLMAVLIAVVIAAAVTVLGQQVSTLFSNAATLI